MGNPDLGNGRTFRSLFKKAGFYGALVIPPKKRTGLAPNRLPINISVKSVVTAVGFICLLLTHQARAQAIDYGALSEIFGEPVTTSATGSPEKASQVPADMEIISADDIRRSGATDIPDILRYYAGIDVRTTGALDQDISIRGYSQPFNPRLLVLINGRQVYLDDYGYTAWQTLPVQLADIRQIEVVRGPASALFGFNAASGVINIITYDPLFDKTNVLDFGLGTNGTYTGALVSTLNEPGKGGITVQLGGLRTNEFSTDSFAGGFPARAARPYHGSYAVDARYKPTNNTEVTLELTQGVAESAYRIVNYEYYTLAYRTNSFKAGIAADTRIGLLTLMAYTNKAYTDYRPPGPISAFDNNEITVVQATDLLKIANSHAVRIGFEYRNNRGSGELFTGAVRYDNFAVDAMWNWQINQSLSFTAAGRSDHLQLMRSDPLTSLDFHTPRDYNHASFTTPSYNFGLVWQPTDIDTFRLLTGRSVQAPSLTQFGLDFQLSTGHVTLLEGGDPNLKPSTTNNYEADYDRQIPLLSSTLRTTVFFNTTNDMIGAAGNLPAAFSDGVISSYSQNFGSGQAVGGEIGLKGSNISGLRWNASYSVVGVRTKTPYAAPEAPLPLDDSTPTNEVDLGGGYSWNRWEFDAQAHWQSNYRDYTFNVGPTGFEYIPVTVDNYVTGSARIGYTVNPHIVLAVAGQELTQARTNGLGALQPRRSVLFTATFSY